MKGKEGERQEAQPYQRLRGDLNSFKNIQATYTHTHANDGPESACGTNEKRPCNRHKSVLKGIIYFSCSVSKVNSPLKGKIYVNNDFNLFFTQSDQITIAIENHGHYKLHNFH